MRTFFCLELPAGVKEELRSTVDSLEEPAYVKWVAQENLHITLKFLGDVERGRIPEIKEKAAEAATGGRTFEMKLDKLSGFPNPGFPKVIWYGSSSPPSEIFALQDDLEGRMADLGFEPEDREYVPHVTLGRTKDDDSKKVEQLGSYLKNRDFSSNWDVKIDQLTLMESRLKSSGPVYEPLFRLDLGDKA